MKPKIIVVGSSNTDMILRVEHLPKPGETILGGHFVTAAGGKGANQAVAAARAGGDVTFVARVGQDGFGTEAIAGFQRDGISVKHVRRDRTEASGVALIFVSRDGENSIGVASGANARLSPADVKRAAAVFKQARVLVTQLETPLETVQTAVELAARRGMRVILNPAPAQPLPDALLRHVSILTPNETEAELLTGIKVKDDKSAAVAACRLLARGVGTVILTLGARGAWVAASDVAERIPGYAVKPVDTTAAGDVFNGTLAVALAEDVPLLDSVRFANAAAAFSVTRLGAQPSAPTRREIDRVLRT